MNHAIVIGDGINGLCAALSLAKRSLRVTLVGPDVGGENDRALICSQHVSDWLKRELPEVERTLIERGARSISIAEILRTRFPLLPARDEDERSKFLCLSQSFFRRALEDRLASSGVEVLRGNVTGLVTNGASRVTGIALGDRRVAANLVIDATGAGAVRAKWLTDAGLRADRTRLVGPSYKVLSRIYRSTASEPISFFLASSHSFRGGVYPLENDRFAISLVVPESLLLEKSEAHAFFDRAIPSIPRATKILASSTPTSELQVLDGIRNGSTDFYSSHSGIEGLFPVGESVFTGNPVYGRGISLAVLELRGLLKGLDASSELDLSLIRSETRKGVAHAKRYWREGAIADTAESGPLKRLRDAYVDFVIPQLETDPALTRRFLYNYQLMLPAWRITGPMQIFRALSLKWPRSPLIIEE
ncbi:MAG: FAD-dependent oxidoreductase [Bdellovibrionota bacterium]